MPDNRPDYNEFPIWSKNHSPRSGKPTMFLLHTQEGGGGDAAAENLAKWFQSGNQVSYHYTVSQASDGGTTVVDCVDTDRAAWSVGNANSISINLCFAGLIIRVLTSEQVQQAIRDILGKLITERILPLVPVVTATAAKAAVDQIVEKVPALDGVVDVVKVGDDARHALNDLIPDIDFGIPPLDAVLDFWRPKGGQ